MVGNGGILYIYGGRGCGQERELTYTMSAEKGEWGSRNETHLWTNSIDFVDT